MDFRTPRPARPRRGDAGRNTEQAIVEAAMRLFMAHGYAAVTMDTIAHAAGVTKPTVYYHFADKGALLVAVSRLVFDRARDATERILAKPEPFRQRLLQIAQTVLMLPQPFSTFDALVREAEQDVTADQLTAVREARRSLTAFLERTMVEAARRGEIRAGNPELAAHGFLALLQVGHVQDETGQPRFPDVPATAEQLVNLLWWGVGPHDDAARNAR